MTIQEARKRMVNQLIEIYDNSEAMNIAEMVMENVTGWPKIEQVTNKEIPLSPTMVEEINEIRERLMKHEPVQYILNESWFHGMKFFVDKNVLIPRPETAELVEWVLQSVQWPQNEGRNYKIMDVGTGSGCIAITLKKLLPSYFEIWACDIDDQALTIARKNADDLEALVDFVPMNFLDPGQQKQLPLVDLVISNPPYVPLNDKGQMSANVVNFEPEKALFVPDNDSLVFYKAIAEFGKEKLQPSGLIFVEIHENLSYEVIQVFSKAGYKTIEIKKDLQGKDRMLKVEG